MDQNIFLLEQQVSNLEKGPFIRSMKLYPGHATRLPAVGRETITSFKEAEVYRMAFEKGLTDRALKLAKFGKLKSNWELQGVLGLAVFILGFLAGK